MGAAKRLTPLLVAFLAVGMFAPHTASAALYGVEANRDLTNSNVSPQRLRHNLDLMKAQGVQVVRGNFGWNEIATPSCAFSSVSALSRADNACYDWRRVDDLAQQTRLRGIRVIVSVTRAPYFVLRSHDPMYVGARAGEFAVFRAHYNAFMTAFASRYAPGSPHGFFQYYTVWSEPNSYNYWKPQSRLRPSMTAVTRYAQLLATTAVGIRRANRFAIVAAGPTGPASKPWKPVPYIRALQQVLPRYLPGSSLYAKRSWVRAWAHNPYPGLTTPPSRGTPQSPVIGMRNIAVLFQTLDRSPVTRGMQVWATEFGYQTNPPNRRFGISISRQGRYIAESFDWLASTRRVTLMTWYGFTDEPTKDPSYWQSGTYFVNGRAKSSVQWFRRPISVPVDRVRRGTRVRVWARSSVAPQRTTIVISTNGRSWRRVTGVRRSGDGSMVWRPRLTRSTWFATFDGVRGPARYVSVS